jgi:hypothetical protein
MSGLFIAISTSIELLRGLSKFSPREDSLNDRGEINGLLIISVIGVRHSRGYPKRDFRVDYQSKNSLARSYVVGGLTLHLPRFSNGSCWRYFYKFRTFTPSIMEFGTTSTGATPVIVKSLRLICTSEKLGANTRIKSACFRNFCNRTINETFRSMHKRW